MIGQHRAVPLLARATRCLRKVPESLSSRPYASLNLWKKEITPEDTDFQVLYIHLTQTKI
ncbi:unnamed protein product [Haemonchus placei]|uniref:Transposase n=1 Tax=Haemonchus placei TaxID=6290 RepID=A0A0N4WIB5_HAEPC|nr:unnamed protein product [Haemonchus placei]